MTTKTFNLIASTVFIIPLISTPLKALILLGILFVFDFITGIGASYVEFHKIKLLDSTAPKHYILTSSKLRLSVVKFITYGLAILIAFGIEWAFVNGEFKLHDNIQTITLTTFVTAFCSIIEIYSIFFENVKRMGFDIIQKIKTISKEGWRLYKTLKNDKTES